MAKIKITESQLKMIVKHKALNEMMDEPELESNSKQYTMIWSVKGFTRVRHIEAPDPIVAYKKFMADVQGLLNWRQTIDDLKWDDIKLDERDEFKSVRGSNIQGVVYYFDGFLSDDEIEDILDRINKGNPHYQSNNNRNANKKMDKPKEGEINESLSGWGDETESAVRKLSKVTIEDFNNMSDEQKSEMEFKMSHYDDNVYDFIIDQIGNVDMDDIVEFAENNEEEFGTESQFVIFAIDDFCSVLGIEDDVEQDDDSDYKMPGFEGTMNESVEKIKASFKRFF
jgi:hypothetical protein